MQAGPLKELSSIKEVVKAQAFSDAESYANSLLSVM